MLSANVPMAVNCRVVPTAILGFAGTIWIAVRGGGVTVRVVEPVTPLNVAEIVVVPMATAVASPPEPVMVATPVFVELHEATGVRSWVAPLASEPVARN